MKNDERRKKKEERRKKKGERKKERKRELLLVLHPTEIRGGCHWPLAGPRGRNRSRVPRILQLVSRQSRESAISTYSSVSIRYKEYIDLKVVSRGAPLLIRCVGGP